MPSTLLKAPFEYALISKVEAHAKRLQAKSDNLQFPNLDGFTGPNGIDKSAKPIHSRIVPGPDFGWVMLIDS